MTTELLLAAILAVLILILTLACVATLVLIKTMRATSAELQAMRRVLANMDWTTIFSNMQAHAKESVRILDILDKRLQKLEALEKIHLTQVTTNTNPISVKRS